MVLDFLTGEFIDVIEWVDDTRDTMVWRYETRGRAIKYGAKLTVREGQAAVRDGARHDDAVVHERAVRESRDGGRDARPARPGRRCAGWRWRWR